MKGPAACQRRHSGALLKRRLVGFESCCRLPAAAFLMIDIDKRSRTGLQAFGERWSGFKVA